MNIIVNTSLKEFAFARKTRMHILAHLFLLSCLFFFVFYNEHQRIFSTFYWDLKTPSQLFSQKISQLGNTLSLKLFELFLWLEFPLLLIFISSLFKNVFLELSLQKRLELLCATPLSCKQIGRQIQMQCFFGLLYFLITTLPFYWICFIFGLSLNLQFFLACFFILMTSSFYLSYTFYFALSPFPSWFKFLEYYGALTLQTLIFLCLALICSWWLRFISFYLWASLFYGIGALYWVKKAPTERIVQWILP